MGGAPPIPNCIDFWFALIMNFRPSRCAAQKKFVDFVKFAVTRTKQKGYETEFGSTFWVVYRTQNEHLVWEMSQTSA